MWKATAGVNINIKESEINKENDDWETDPDFINDVTEQEQRWGSKTVEGSGRNAGAIDMAKLRKETEEADAEIKKKQKAEGPDAAFGYGGKFGVQTDRMDHSAVGHDYTPKLEKHRSQIDYSTGFGGKFGVQTDRVDKSAVSWKHKEKIEKHSSQKDYSAGFGGKFGIQTDRQDRSAVGWDHVERVEKHESQKDYSKGFGGKFGVQSDRQDQCAVGWDHHEAPQKHESQTDHKIGFGGKFGIQKDRMDKSAASFQDPPAETAQTKPDIVVNATKSSSELRAKFENIGQSNGKPAERLPTPKQLNATQMDAFVKKDTPVNVAASVQSKPLDQSRVAMFAKQPVIEEPVLNKTTTIQTEQKQIVEVEKPPEIQQNVVNEEPPVTEVVLEDTGLTAIALYDYQAAADDEISFDPDDVVTNVEMIDEGWWRGLCRNRYGLFPANYVQLQQQ